MTERFVVSLCGAVLLAAAIGGDAVALTTAAAFSLGWMMGRHDDR